LRIRLHGARTDYTGPLRADFRIGDVTDARVTSRISVAVRETAGLIGIKLEAVLSCLPRSDFLQRTIHLTYVKRRLRHGIKLSSVALRCFRR
jgi:hypothetical protein